MQPDIPIFLDYWALTPIGLGWGYHIVGLFSNTIPSPSENIPKACRKYAEDDPIMIPRDQGVSILRASPTAAGPSSKH